MHGISFSSEWISSRKLFAMFYWLHLGLATKTVHCICISGLWTPQEVLLKLEAAGLFTNEQLLLYDLYSFKKAGSLQIFKLEQTTSLEEQQHTIMLHWLTQEKSCPHRNQVYIVLWYNMIWRYRKHCKCKHMTIADDCCKCMQMYFRSSKHIFEARRSLRAMTPWETL